MYKLENINISKDVSERFSLKTLLLFIQYSIGYHLFDMML